MREGEQEHLLHAFQGRGEGLGTAEISDHGLHPPGLQVRAGVLPADHGPEFHALGQ